MCLSSISKVLRRSLLPAHPALGPSGNICEGSIARSNPVHAVICGNQPGMSFDLQPCLKGQLLELRPLRPDDYRDLYAVASDPLLWEQHPARDRYQEPVFQQFFEEALRSGEALTIVDCKDRRVIGSSRFHGYDDVRSEVEIGWTFLARSHW